MRALVTLILLPISLAAAARLAPFDPPQKFPNIDFVGLGYDVYRGNPRSHVYDNGWRGPVIRLNYSRGDQSSDGRWLIPNNVQVLRSVGCSYDSTAIEVKGGTSLQHSMKEDTGLEIGITIEDFSAAFSNSKSFKETVNSTHNFKRTYMETVADCVSYKAKLKRLLPIPIHADLYDAVEALPLTHQVNVYLDFIEEFGTHYSSETFMGAKASLVSEFEELSWSDMVTRGIDTKRGAKVSFLFFTGSTSGESEQSLQIGREFEQRRSKVEMRFLGSRPSSDGRWESWAQTTDAHPYPMKYQLRPLVELFTERNFVGMRQDQLSQKANLIRATFAEHCKRLPGCGKPQPDPRTILYSSSQVVHVLHKNVECPDGNEFKLLSCSGHSTQWQQEEKWKHVFPVNGRTCQCFSNFGSNCVAWCTDSELKNFEIVEREGASVRVDCPAGKKVLGCHHNPQVWSVVFNFRSYYPTEDGQGCQCLDLLPGSKCIATCASDIRHYKIESHYGKGNFGVSCQGGRVVLGCGIDPFPKGGPHDKIRSVWVSSRSSCNCIDSQGATCYAVCGLI